MADKETWQALLDWLQSGSGNGFWERIKQDRQNFMIHSIAPRQKKEPLNEMRYRRDDYASKAEAMDAVLELKEELTDEAKHILK